MEALGINLQNLIINTLLLLVLFGVVHKFFIKKIETVLEERRKKIDAGVKNYDDTKEALMKANNDYEEKIKKAHKEAESIIKGAQVNAELTSREIIKKTQDETKKIIEKGEEVLKQKETRLEAEFDERLKKQVKLSLKNLLAENADKIDYDTTALNQLSSLK